MKKEVKKYGCPYCGSSVAMTHVTFHHVIVDLETRQIIKPGAPGDMMIRDESVATCSECGKTTHVRDWDLKRKEREAQYGRPKFESTTGHI